MRNSVHLGVTTAVIVLAVVTTVGYSRFVPNAAHVHLGRVSHPRRWGKWCQEDIDCGNGLCRAYVCECYYGYMTWRYMDVCGYEQRLKLTAFLLSFFLGSLGVDWFYLSRGNAGYIVAGIIKLLITCGCCCIWPIIVAATRKKAIGGSIILVKFFSAILTVCSFVWWLTDWIRILANVFDDGNGAPLQSWSYRLDYGLRY